jgi:predicted nucleotidyltransferase
MRKLSRSLDALFPKTRQGILAATLVQPEKIWFVSELARRLGIPSSSLQRELEGLSDAGILRTHRQGRMVFVQANVDSPLFPDLRALLLKTAGLVDVLADVLKALGSKVHIAFVYGSIASGQEHTDSDIDLMVVGAVSPMELSLPLRSARELLGRPINPTVYSLAEFESKCQADDHFLLHVLDKPKLFVIGTEHELGQISRPIRHA